MDSQLVPPAHGKIVWLSRVWNAEDSYDCAECDEGSLLMDVTNVGLSPVMGRHRAEPPRRTNITMELEAKVPDGSSRTRQERVAEFGFGGSECGGSAKVLKHGFTQLVSVD
jgi:hypothetical protein